MFIAALLALAMQPEAAGLRILFEQGLEHGGRELGAPDPETAQAARDAGRFLVNVGDTVTARRALSEAVQIDERTSGPASSEPLEDVADLAAVAPPAKVNGFGGGQRARPMQHCGR